jgi:peptidoglycan hydrolase-like protein with peptidoglycan-binding domain
MFGIKVEHRLMNRPGGKPLIPVGKTGILNTHTTEGFGIEGAWNTLNQKHSAPTFIAGEDRIIQTRPLGTQGAALLGGRATNGLCEVQVEIIGFSQQKLWQLRPQDFRSAVALMAFCKSVLKIPLTRPAQWPDDLSDMKGEILATSHNSRRKSGIVKAGFKGIAMHLEFPLNNHWNCGALNWTELIAAAEGLINGVPVPPPAHPLKLKIEMPTVGRGDHGFKVEAAIKKLQNILGITPDGFFGSDTEDHVKEFQTANKLTADGVVGPKTWKVLLAK